MQVSNGLHAIAVSDNLQNSTHTVPLCRFGQRHQIDNSKYSQVIYYSDQVWLYTQY